MPEKRTTRRAAKAKSPSTEAGAYVREEMEHVREGKHGARSTKQAIAIGLSKARRAGVKVANPKGKKSTAKATHHKPNPKRSRASTNALKREGKSAASHRAISRQAKQSARKRQTQRSSEEGCPHAGRPVARPERRPPLRHFF